MYIHTISFFSHSRTMKKMHCPLSQLSRKLFMASEERKNASQLLFTCCALRKNPVRENSVTIGTIRQPFFSRCWSKLWGIKTGRLFGSAFVFCTPAGVRTLDTLIKSQVLYQLSYGCIVCSRKRVARGLFSDLRVQRYRFLSERPNVFAIFFLKQTKKGCFYDSQVPRCCYSLSAA